MRLVGKIFLRGVAVILPVALTLYILWWLGITAERVFGGLVQRLLPAGVYVPGTGLAFGVATVFIVGLLFRAWWIRTVWAGLERLLARVPLVKTIYGSIKDLMSFFAEGDRKRELNQVVLLRVGNDPPMKLLGLVTSADVEEIVGKGEAARDQVAVYLPMSYQIGGFMVFVPRDAIEPVDLGVEEALRTIITAGMSNSAPPDGDATDGRPG